MSTSISRAHDAMRALLLELFPDHSELIDPYNPDVNDDLSYKGSWGVGFAEADKADENIGCFYSVDRSLIVTLTRKIFKGDLQRNSGAVAERVAKEKQLFEDLHSLIKKTEQNVTLNDADAGIAWCLFRSDSGLEYVRVDDNQLVMVRAIFNLHYRESLED